MNIFNNPDLKYNYEGNGDMNDFTNPFSNVTGAIGTNIVSASIPQKNVEGLVNDLSALSVGIEESYNEFQSFKKDAEHSIELNKKKIDDFLMIQIGANDRVNLELDELSKQNNKRVEEIVALENELTDVYWHIDQLYDKLYNQTLKLEKESMIMFFMVILLFVIDLATIWCYIRK